MNDLTTINAQPRLIRIAGGEYAIHPFTLEDFGKLQQWVDRQFPDPFDVVNRQIERGRPVVRDGKEAREPYSVSQQQFLFRLADENANKGRRLIGTPEADEKIQAMEGVIEMLYLAISKGDPSFTRGKADALFKAMTFVDIARVQQATNVDMVTSDPKAPGPGTTTPVGPTTA